MKLKYYLKGFGVGIIFATLLLAIAFYAGTQDSKPISKQEVERLAAAYGMVYPDETTIEENSDGESETISEAETAREQGTTRETETTREQGTTRETETTREQGTTRETETIPQGITGETEVDQQGISKETEDVPQGIIRETEDVSQGITEETKADQRGIIRETEIVRQGITKETEAVQQEISGDTETAQQGIAGETGEVDTARELEGSGELQTVWEDTLVIEKTITVPSGMYASAIAELLEDSGIIESAREFSLYLIRGGYTKRLRAGIYTFIVGTDFETIAGKLLWESD